MICWNMQTPQPTTRYQGVGQFVYYAVIKDVLTKLLKKGYVLDMVSRSKVVDMKDVLIKQRREEFVSDMVHLVLLAATKGVPIKSLREEFVKGMVHK